ncbi:MAG TPA: pitrilysin family protein [Ignavibacteriaceae bacterium]|nr:pitrilysin family protein [Ignavibacteriaceae bacterium]
MIIKFHSYIVLTLITLLFVNLNAKGKYEEGKLYRHKLDNGMVVLTVERHIAPLIYHQLTYKVGSRNEKLGTTGISHVVEHMMFKGTPKYGKGETSRIISANSGIFNAFTANDMTSYYEYLPKNKIEIAFDIESDRMQNAVFNSSEFKSEIEVIVQERRMRSESQANGIMSETMNSVCYVSHPNRDPIIGWPGDLYNITREDAYNYYKTYYTPNNSFLVLVGDFDTDKIIELVNKYYNKIPKGPEVRPMNSVEQEQRVRKTFNLYHSDITQPGFRMAFHAPLYSDPDAAILRVAGMILCEKSRDARLYKRLVENDRIVSSVAGGFGMAKDPGLFQISVSVRPDSSLDKVEKSIWEEISLMQNEPVTDHELQKIKNRYRFNQSTSYIKNTDIGTRISRYEAFFGWEFLEQFDARVMSVTKEDIMRVMKKYFATEKVTVGYLFPKEGPKTLVKNTGGEDEEGTKPKDDSEGIYNTDDKFYYKNSKEALDITINELLGKDEEVIKPAPIAPMIKTFKLKNGVTLYTIENHLVPSVSIIGSVETGVIPEALEGGQPGIAALLGDLMNRGTEKLSYKELSERMAFVPFSFSVSGNYRGFFFQGNSLVTDADEMMKTGLDIVVNPAYRNEDLKRLLPGHILNAKNRLKKASVKAFYYMFNSLFEDHTLTKYNPTEESLNSIKLEDLRDLHDKYFNPANTFLLMVGDMTPEQMRTLADKYFGTWENDNIPITIPTIQPVKDLSKKEIKVFNEKDYTECTINVGFKPYNKIDASEDEIVSVLNYILAQSALTSRMGVELRDKQGLIYGIKSELWYKSDNIGYWKFNTKTGPQNTEKVIKGIFSEIKKLLKDGITDEELNGAKQRQLGLLPFYIETPDDAASIMFEQIREGKPFDFFDKKAQRILSITKADVMRIAKKYFTLDKYIIVVDGPIEENALEHLKNEL